MGSIVPIIVIAMVIIFIVFVKYKDYKDKTTNPTKKWEGKTHKEYEKDKQNIERKTEAHKGNGRAGGPF